MKDLQGKEREKERREGGRYDDRVLAGARRLRPELAGVGRSGWTRPQKRGLIVVQV